jgi:cytochrome b involved in lipid metabolism
MSKQSTLQKEEPALQHSESDIEQPANQISTSVVTEERKHNAQSLTTSETKKTSAWSRRLVSLGIGISALMIVGIGTFFYMKNNDLGLSNKTKNNQGNYSSTDLLTSADLVTHSESSDCWLVIENTVYDLTSYAPHHPGGSQVITNLCGTDATSEYLAQHPSSLVTTLPGATVGPFE